MRSMETAAALALAACALGAVFARAADSPSNPLPPAPACEVLVVGTYHMANPGRDIFNVEADDVLATRRQAELEQLVEVLARFRPTKIAVERAAGDERIRRDYEAYVAGTRELTRNEIEQIGFRLAAKLGHDTVHPVDADGEFPFLRLEKYAKATGRSSELDALMGEVGATVRATDTYLRSHTVLETLLYLDSDARIAEDLGFYFRQAEFSEPWDWAGPDLVADWFRRNMRIYGNIAHLASPGERVLVLYGAGHLGWLQHAFASNPKFRLRRLAEFVE